MPNFEELGFKVGPFFLVKTIYFQLQSYAEILSLAKTPAWIGVENGRFYPIKKGPASKPSSLKLGTCQGRNSLTLGYQTPF